MAVLFMAGLFGCSSEAKLPTGNSNSAHLQGQVVPSGEISGASPAGISVGVVGTGLAAVTDAEGKFAFFGLPDGGATLRFSRDNDGIDATLDLREVTSFLLVELGRDSANARRRGMGRPGNGAGHPGQEAEGVIVSFEDDTLVLRTGNRVEWEFVVDEDTVIRKGNQILNEEALEAGARVHVKATLGEERRAVEIKLRGDDDDDDDGDDEDRGGAVATANGIVGEVGDDFLVVNTADGREVRVLVDEETRIKRRGRSFPLSEIVAGDRAEVLGVRVEDGVILAKKIETQPARGGEGEGEEGDDDPAATANGVVAEVGDESLVVNTADGRTFTVQVNEQTIIKRKGRLIELSDIKAGDRAEVQGEWVDASTILARKIETQAR